MLVLVHIGSSIIFQSCSKNNFSVLTIGDLGSLYVWITPNMIDFALYFYSNPMTTIKTGHVIEMTQP